MHYHFPDLRTETFKLPMKIAKYNLIRYVVNNIFIVNGKTECLSSHFRVV